MARASARTRTRTSARASARARARKGEAHQVGEAGWWGSIDEGCDALANVGPEDGGARVEGKTHKRTDEGLKMNEQRHKWIEQ